MSVKGKLAVNIPDCHIPWHNQIVVQLMLMAMDFLHAVYGIDQINILGDTLDYFWVKLHPKLPSEYGMKGTFKDEAYIGHHFFKMLERRYPGAEIKYFEGNHEWRLARYLIAKAPELFDIVNTEGLLKLDEIDLQFIPYGKQQLEPCLDTDYYLRHVPYNMGKHCAAATIANKHISLGFGHTHRKQSFSCKDALGKELTGRSLGWLGDRLAPPFGFMDVDDWTLGFEYGWSINGRWHSTYVDMVENNNTFSCVVEGQVYTGDYIPYYRGDVDQVIRGFESGE